MHHFITQANEDVTQIVKVVPPGPAKWTWLTSRLVQLTTGTVLYGLISLSENGSSCGFLCSL